MLRYQLAVFLGSFLLFQIQPVAAKALLPAFGGSAMVWGAGMAFFQAMLLLGYLYVHLVPARLSPRRGALLHLTVAAAAVLLHSTAVLFDADIGLNLPLFLRVGLLLAVALALPVFVLAGNSVLLQQWLLDGDRAQTATVYTLYSASNIGSIAALLSYPLVVEPLLSLNNQLRLWQGLYLVLLVLLVSCAPWQQRRRRAAVPTTDAIAAVDPAAAASRGWRQLSTWMLLSAAGTALLVATTNMISLDLASAPFLWVMPLALYLLSFVVTFNRRPWLPARDARLPIYAIVGALLLYCIFIFQMTLAVLPLLLIYLGVFFVLCLCCHARLVQCRPQLPGQLTRFYLTLAFGGMLGSVVVAWLVPALSNRLVEYPLALVMAAVALALADKILSVSTNHLQLVAPQLPEVCQAQISKKQIVGKGSGQGGQIRGAGELLPRHRRALVTTAAYCAAVAGCMLGLPWLLSQVLQLSTTLVFIAVSLPLTLICLQAASSLPQLTWILLAVLVFGKYSEPLVSGVSTVERARNYYGLYHVYDAGGQRFLKHGSTLHGRQYLDPERAAMALSYYHRSTGAGKLLAAAADLQLRDIGMIGLGTGALLSYLQPGQNMAVYELDPANIPIAEQQFSYVQHAAAPVRFVVGDGRLRLQQEPEASFDLLILDAFSSGAIPVHLLTVEALQEYARVLRPAGILLIHISNKLLDLEPVASSVGRAAGYEIFAQVNDSLPGSDADSAVWLALTRSRAATQLLQQSAFWQPSPVTPVRPWTDQYSNIVAALWRR